MDPEIAFVTLLSGIFGILIGSIAFWFYSKTRFGTFKKLAEEIVQKAEREAESLKKDTALELHNEKIALHNEAEKQLQKDRKRMQKEGERIKEREDILERRMSLVERKLSEIEKREVILQGRRDELEKEKKQTQIHREKALIELEQASGLTRDEAKAVLYEKLSREVEQEAAQTTKRLIKEAEETAEREAKTILTTTMNRLAGSCVSDVTVATVTLPSEEMKGRIIGREGRNIRALENAAGVNFLIDDTPGVVVISGFDPIRKEIARIALSDLVGDGRIHPTRIEEAFSQATKKVNTEIKNIGEDAALRVGAMNLAPELHELIGKLKFRYSYGQNVLDHSLEVAHLMGMIAEELGVDSSLARRIGLLHDMGKAVSHEMPGSHAVIGHDLALKYGETDAVANGIGCHHEEMEPITIEGTLCAIADRLSATRPGARMEAVEEYLKRLKKLEDIAYEFPGIEKAYAMQAGREIRIVVLPDMIDDHGLVTLSRDLSKKIEKEMTYPGQIKVTVVREKRVVSYAS